MSLLDITNTRRDEHNETILNWKNNENICVMARFRSINTFEQQQCDKKGLQEDTPYIDKNIVTISNHAYKPRSKMVRSEYKIVLDHIFDVKSDQRRVYKITAEPLINEALDGFNISLLAYGETGAGKTYSMFGGQRIKHLNHLIFGYVRNMNISFPMDLLKLLIMYTNYQNEFEFLYPSNIDNDTMGIIPRSIIYLFEKLEAKCNQQIIQTFSVSIQVIQIYKDQLLDLLNLQNKSKLQITTDDINSCIYVKHLTAIDITSPTEGIYALFKASKNRAIFHEQLGGHGYIARRSIVVLLKVKQKCIDGSILRSQIHFGDLAGSERRNYAESESGRRLEASSHNYALSLLLKCINSLSKGEDPPNIRDGPISHIFQDALGCNGKALFLVCVSPSIYNRNETFRSLRFATTTLKCKNKGKINVTLSSEPLQEKIKELVFENIELKTDLAVINGTAEQVINCKMKLDELLKQERESNNLLIERQKEKCLELEKCNEIVNELKVDNDKMNDVLNNVDHESLQKQLKELQCLMKYLLDNEILQSENGCNEGVIDIEDERNAYQRNQQIGNDILQSNRECWSSVFFDTH